MPQIVTLGETMAAFAPGAAGALRYVADYRLRAAGAESNVAVGLAKLGVDAAWISRVGRDEFGMFIRNQLRGEGVDCAGVVFDPAHRTGVMFKELGAGETKVYYYRENSAASHMSPDDLDEGLFRGARILHLTGITPVLSESCRETAEAAAALAERLGLRLSFDPNIRKRLWGARDFTPLIRSLTLRSQIVEMGLDEAETLFGTRDPDAVLRILFSEGKAEYAALKDGANGALTADKGARYRIPPFPCRSVDPVGAGDGFNAGFLAGLLQGLGAETAGRMGGICGALATQTTGDVEGYPDAALMETLLGGGSVVYR